MNEVVQRQATGEVVEVPGIVAEFVEAAPWRPIQSLQARLDGRDPCAPTDPLGCEHQRELFGADVLADPHWYVIRAWERVETSRFDLAAEAIRKLGYRARYIRPYNPRPLMNDYLDLDGFVYWHIRPQQLCRTRREWHQHEPLPKQMGML